MILHILSFIFFILFTDGASGATIMVTNMCGFTVWPGISGNPDINITGFELQEGKSRSFKTPETWEGQIWGRIGCNFNDSGYGLCRTGDCGLGQMECIGRNYTPPVTIADFRLSHWDSNYDVSVLKGFNLPMMLAPNGLSGNCNKKGCAEDLNQECLSELKLEGGGGCKSPCQAYPSREYCCNISSTEVSCKETAYTRWFKSACPRSSATISDFDTNMGYEYSCHTDEYVVAFCPLADYFTSVKSGLLLQYTDQLISIGGNFTLGFFSSEDDFYRYLGIWYTNDVKSSKVWVANPNKPIETSFDDLALSIDPNNGNLIITAGGTNLMNITDVQAGSNPNVTATLLENGNFRLINEIDKRVLWQSFDHPTNVLLPGMKLGSNMTSGQNWTLTSWLSDDIYDSGAFTLSWEPIDEANQRLMIRQRGQPYWTSGRFLDVKTFESMSLLDEYRQSKYVLSPVYNSKEQYLSYIHNPDNGGTTDTFPMWILTPNGQITNYNYADVWTPELCYGYNSNDGCIKSILPQCRREDKFFSYGNEEFASPDISISTDNNSSLSISDCFVKCWNDCRCVGYNSSSTNGTGCILWSGNNIDFLMNSKDNPTFKYVINTRINPFKKINMKLIWTFASVTVALVFLCLGRLWYMKKREQKRKEYQRRRKRDEYFLELTASESFKDIHQLESNVGNGNDLLLFSFASIMAATDDFSVENKLGQGGFGPVYKGRLSDGREIAIKRLSKTSGQGLVEFKNELILIAKLQHTNLVRVLGCCIHGEEKMLIYEFMPNKSLDYILFDKNRKAELDWPKRFNIIEGIAQGLLYLHKYSRMRVIHRDLKANNILLDESLNPKISDFGMARIFKENETQAMTNRVVGTYGYMSPEYAMEGTFSIKSDIYSFGVMILEIVTGRRNSSFVHLDRTFNLLGYAWELWQQGDAMKLEDPTLGSSCVVQQFLRTVHVALLCVQESAADRPTISDMISMLLNDTISLPTPNKPAFFTGRVMSKSTSNEIKPENCSANNVTITNMEGR